MKNRYRILLLTCLITGCGHTASYKVGLMSIGDLEGKTLPKQIVANIAEGYDCGYSYSLSNAVRNALKDSSYDTLIDAEVTSVTGWIEHSNCLSVKGTPLDSKQLSRQ